jgi:vacuolar-type H+-ATPase subunit I/STV1
VDVVERETLRYNDAVTKLAQTRDEAIAVQSAKSIAALTAQAKSRLKADDSAGEAEAWRAVLTIDREHKDARNYFTALSTLAQVLAKLDEKTDLLGNVITPPESPSKGEKEEKKP